MTLDNNFDRTTTLRLIDMRFTKTSNYAQSSLSIVEMNKGARE